MPFFFAESFFAVLDQRRICVITGMPGAAKTAMAFDLARYYLQRGYRLSANIETAWNDPLTYTREQYLEHSPILSREIRFGRITREQALESLPERLPWVFKKVFVLDEGGQELRMWKYFGDMARFPRKFRNYIIIPSLEIPHADLSQLIVFPEPKFRTFFPFAPPGGLFHWQFSNGFRLPITGWFYYFASDVIGVYDTDDLGDTTQYVIETFSKAIEQRQREYNRLRFRAVGAAADDETVRIEETNSRRAEAVAMALLNQGRAK